MRLFCCRLNADLETLNPKPSTLLFYTGFVSICGVVRCDAVNHTQRNSNYYIWFYNVSSLLWVRLATFWPGKLQPQMSTMVDKGGYALG